MQLLEEICENTRAIRRVANWILDHLHEYQTDGFGPKSAKPDTDEWSWDDLDSQEQAQPGPCTAKSTIYCANIVAGLMLSPYCKKRHPSPISLLNIVCSCQA